MPKEPRDTATQSDETGWVNGDPAPTVAPTEAPTEAPTAAPVQVNQVVPAAQSVDSMPISAAAKICLHEIAEYIEAMNPRRPLKSQDGANLQSKFYRTLRRILSLGEEFNMVWSSLLAEFQKHSTGVFDNNNLLRCTEHMTLPKADVQAFCTLMNLLKITASVQTRAHVMKQYNFKLAFKSMTESEIHCLQTFYNL